MSFTIFDVFSRIESESVQGDFLFSEGCSVSLEKVLDFDRTRAHLFGPATALRPRVAFILWLVAPKAILTRDKLNARGMVVMEPLMSWMKLKKKACCWSEWLAWWSKVARGKTLLAKRRRMIMAEMIARIWKERNMRIFRMQFRSRAQLIDSFLHVQWYKKIDSKNRLIKCVS
ncbi:hypothetical protein AKJ16_DCAP08746 [Drosera capensis]